MNSVLADGYYTKAEIDGKITALTTQLTNVDAKLQQEIDDLEAALAKAESDLTAAYKQAIENAFAEGGIINNAIAQEVQKAQDHLQTQIDYINYKIIDIEARLKNVESQIATLLDQIQSVTFVPQYSDGKVRMDYATRQTSLDFMINPTRLSADLETAWAADNAIIKAYVRYTDDPTTRAVASPIELTIENVTASTTDKGLISLDVRENGDNIIETAFWNGSKEAVIYIVISNGVTEIASEAIPMISHKYAGNTNSIGGYGDGGTQSGEASE